MKQLSEKRDMFINCCCNVFCSKYRAYILCCSNMMSPLYVYHIQGRRNVFTTRQAKFDHEDYAIKCVGSRQFMNVEIVFLPLILQCYHPKMLKNHTQLYLLLSFCTTEYLVSITINGMRGPPIILHLLICLFYLL